MTVGISKLNVLQERRKRVGVLQSNMSHISAASIVP